MPNHLADQRIAATLARRAARAQGISGREIARRMQVTQVYVSRRLSGAVEFSENDIRRFAEVLNVPASSLLEEGTK